MSKFSSLVEIVEGMTSASRFKIAALAASINGLFDAEMDEDTLLAIVGCLVPIHWEHGERDFIDLLLKKVKGNEKDAVTVHRIRKLIFSPDRDELWVRNALAPALRLAGSPSPRSVCAFVFAAPDQVEKIALETAQKISRDSALSRAFGWKKQ